MLTNNEYSMFPLLHTFPGVGHGDDLPFIFDPEALDGNTSFSGLVLTDHNDQKVQDTVTSFIAEFAHNGLVISWIPTSIILK
jgi:hypothetical protein